MPLAPSRSDRAASARARSPHRCLPRRGRHDLVHQPPFDGAFAAHAFLGGAEDVGAVAADTALVGQAGQAAGAGQHRQQRQFRQRNGRAAVVDQHDVVGGHRELIAAAGRAAADRGQVGLAGIFAGVLDRQSGFVGELAEIHLVAVRGLAEHADVGAGAEHAFLGGTQDDGPDLGMLEAQPLHGVGEFDVDAEVVGIQFQFVAVRSGRRPDRRPCVSVATGPSKDSFQWR